MKTRTCLLLILAAAVSGFAFGQVTSNPLPPLTGPQRQELAAEIRGWGDHMLFLKSLLAPPHSPPTSGTYADGFAQACYFVADRLEDPNLNPQPVGLGSTARPAAQP